MNPTELLPLVKQNLILDTSEDDGLLTSFISAAVDYAQDYQHLPNGHYQEHEASQTTKQAVIMLASHFYESRDGSTAGFWGDNPQAAQSVWDTVNRLLRLHREWKV